MKFDNEIFRTLPYKLKKNPEKQAIKTWLYKQIKLFNVLTYLGFAAIIIGVSQIYDNSKNIDNYIYLSAFPLMIWFFQKSKKRVKSYLDHEIDSHFKND